VATPAAPMPHVRRASARARRPTGRLKPCSTPPRRVWRTPAPRTVPQKMHVRRPGRAPAAGGGTASACAPPGFAAARATARLHGPRGWRPVPHARACLVPLRCSRARAAPARLALRAGCPQQLPREGCLPGRRKHPRLARAALCGDSLAALGPAAAGARARARAPAPTHAGRGPKLI